MTDAAANISLIGVALILAGIWCWILWQERRDEKNAQERHKNRLDFPKSK